MIRIDTRVASLRFSRLLVHYSNTNPQVRFELPKLSLSYLFIYFFTLATLPFTLLIAILEITRTRKNFLTTISMFIPVILTKKTFANSVKKYFRSISPNKFRSKRTKIDNKFYISSDFLPREKIWIGLSSPLLPFSSLFPVKKEYQYIKLISYEDFRLNFQNITELAKLPYLPSVANTYENILLHYFDLLSKCILHKDDSSSFTLTCNNSISNPIGVLQLIAKRISVDFHKIFAIAFLKKKYTWNVRIQNGSYNCSHILFNLENPKNGYYADPFLLEYFDDIYLFVEEYSFLTLKGVIVVFKFSDGKFERLGVCLEEKFHLSFPNVFLDGEHIYMIPESSENSDVRLYRAIDFPMKWELSTQLLTNISAVDSIVFKRNHEYFLLTTVDLYNLGDYTTSLNLYKSTNLNSSVWFESKLNPIIRDSEKGRNAGKYSQNILDNYRMAQASIFGVYGAKIRLFSVRDLSLEQFSEAEIELPKLDIPSDSNGHHHLSKVRDFYAFDYSIFIKSN